MASKGSSSLIICCFLFIMILIFIPQSLSTRILEDTPRNNSLSETKANDQSKSGVKGSQSPHAGSATGDNNSPPGNSVNGTNSANPSPTNTGNLIGPFVVYPSPTKTGNGGAPNVVANPSPP